MTVTTRIALLAVLMGIAAPADATPPVSRYAGAGGMVRLTYPKPLRPSREGVGNDLSGGAGGWRVMWNGDPVGPGTLVVSFSASGLKHDGGVWDRVIESMQIGMSDDAGVVARCGTAGLKGANGRRLPDRRLGGHRWTVYANGDNGMSQSTLGIDYRTVVDGVCYAITRMTYSQNGIAPPSHPGPSDKVAAAEIDAVLRSVQVGGRR